MLTPNEKIYALAKVKGLSSEMAAVAAGCDPLIAIAVGRSFDQNVEIQNFIAERLKDIVGNPEDKNLDPLVFLQQQLNDSTLDKEMRIKIAVQLLPYKHKKVVTPAARKSKTEEAREKLENAETGAFGAAPPPKGNLRAVK